MKNILIILIFIFYGFTTHKTTVKITYIANCGFLITNQSVKVLIDPFGTEFGAYFYLPSALTKTNIEEGNIPFDNINFVLITHIHGDHFNPFLAERFLQKNKGTKMVCPAQVRNQMKNSCVNYLQIEPQIICPQVSANNFETISINNISVTAIKMQHGTNRDLKGIRYDDYTEYEKTENFGYLVNFNDKVIFHQGDACLKMNEEILSKLNKKVDVAFLSYFDWDSTSFNILKDKLHAQNIIFMHGTKPAKELKNEQFKAIIPKLSFFNQELESKIFE
jgi:L-ascorbate metabolism protein UlaG (beta-lactamase superfamily)